MVVRGGRGRGVVRVEEGRRGSAQPDRRAPLSCRTSCKVPRSAYQIPPAFQYSCSTVSHSELPNALFHVFFDTKESFPISCQSEVYKRE